MGDISEGSWTLAPEGYAPFGPYLTPQFPIQKNKLPKPWLVIDECFGKSIEVKAFRNEDMLERMLPAEVWAGWPNKRRLSDWHNEPFKRSTRLAFARMTQFTEQHITVMDNHILSVDALNLQKMIKDDPDSQHISGRLDWSPTGQVWRDGHRWVQLNYRR